MELAIQTTDLVIVVTYVGAVVLFGMWVGRGQRGLSDYLLGGRDLPWWAILGSLVATETSTATFLSVPGVAFAATGDLRFLQLAIGFVIGRIIVAAVLLPLYFKGQLFTAYEVLDRRFGGATKTAASLTFLVARNLGDGLRLFLTAIVLKEVAGINLSVCVVLIGAATIVYTLLGGMKAVVWNDCIQFVVYIAGGLVAGALIIDSLPGGWSQWWEYARTNHKLTMFDFRWDVTEAYTFWAGLLGGATLTMGTHGADQMMVQRYLCARSQRDATRALVLSGFVVFFQFALFLLLGVGLACYYTSVSPETQFDRNDEVFATFIVRQMPVGLVGLTLAAVFSAAMSTLSSSLNSSAGAAVNDLYRPRWKQEPSSEHLVRVSRLMTAVFGALQIGVAIAASHYSRSVVEDALAVAGFAAGILIGIFALGTRTRRVGQQAALGGMLCGLLVLAAVKFGTDIAWPWYALIGASATFGAGWLLSWVRSEAKG